MTYNPLSFEYRPNRFTGKPLVEARAVVWAHPVTAGDPPFAAIYFVHTNLTGEVQPWDETFDRELAFDKAKRDALLSGMHY